MNAIIISVGDELTSGLTLNSNAAWLGRQLSDLGISCQLQLTIGDNQAAIVAAIRQSVAQCDILLISGGLGPTEDDLTRASVAEALGEPLVQDQAAMGDLEAFFKRINHTMTDNNRLQAMRPLSASCVKNSCGTAPGIMARLGKTQIFVMPGVPKEMKAMFEQSYKPLLQAAAGGVVRRIMALNICGAGESWIGSHIADLMKRGTNPAVGTTVHDGIVSVRIYATGQPAEVSAMIDEMASTVRRRLADLIFSTDHVTLEEVVIQNLLQHGMTVTTAESCTGGWVAMMLTNVPGSSACFKRGWVTTATKANRPILVLILNSLKHTEPSAGKWRVPWHSRPGAGRRRIGPLRLPAMPVQQPTVRKIPWDGSISALPARTDVMIYTYAPVNSPATAQAFACAAVRWR